MSVASSPGEMIPERWLSVWNSPPLDHVRCQVWGQVCRGEQARWKVSMFYLKVRTISVQHNLKYWIAGPVEGFGAAEEPRAP